MPVSLGATVRERKIELNVSARCAMPCLEKKKLGLQNLVVAWRCSVRIYVSK